MIIEYISNTYLGDVVPNVVQVLVYSFDCFFVAGILLPISDDEYDVLDGILLEQLQVHLHDDADDG